MPKSVQSSKACGSRRRKTERNGAVSPIPRCLSFEHHIYFTRFPKFGVNEWIFTSTQILEEPPRYSIYQTKKGLPPSGFHIGKISRVCRSLQLQLLTAWVRMPIVRTSILIWELCTRPIMHQEAHGRVSITICRLLHWVNNHLKCSNNGQ